MNVQAVLNFFDIISMIMMMGIIVVYSLATFWNIKFLMVSKWQIYSGIKVYITSCCAIFTVMYIYILTKAVLGVPTDVNLFGAIVVRPAIFLMGGAIASSARARLVSLNHGGEKWMLRSGKIL